MTLQGGLGALVQGEGFLFWAVLAMAVVLLVAWFVLVIILYANMKAHPHHIPGVMPGSSEPGLKWKHEVLQAKMKQLFENLGRLLLSAGPAAAMKVKDRVSRIQVNKLITYDKSHVPERLMPAMATRWMALAAAIFCIPIIYITMLFSTQGSDTFLTTSMVGTVILVTCLGYLAWGMRQYIAQHVDVEQLTMMYLYFIIIALISTKTVSSYTSGSIAAHDNMFELGDCVAKRRRSKNQVTDMLTTLGNVEKNAWRSLYQAYTAVFLSLATLACSYLSTEATLFFAALMWASLFGAGTFYFFSSRNLRSFRRSLRTMERIVFEEVYRKASVTAMTEKEFVVAATKALRDILHNAQASTAHYLEEVGEDLV